MTSEILFFTNDVEQARTAIAEAGGRVSHVLSGHLVAGLLPEGVGLSSVPGASPVDLERLEGMELRLARAWISRLGAESVPAERSAKAGPAVSWDAPGRLPPDGPPQPASAKDPPRDGDSIAREPDLERSTGTPTSRTMTGSVSVGIIMVSGPPEAWLFTQGALKHVSVAGDGTVWGVNAADQIFRRDGSSWTRIAGALKQVSTGSAAQVWGVNSADNIFQWNGGSWTRIPGALKHVSVAADGTVWGVNAADQIFRRDGSSWTRIPGALKQVSTGSAGRVWGVNSADNIFQLA